MIVDFIEPNYEKDISNVRYLIELNIRLGCQVNFRYETVRNDCFFVVCSVINKSCTCGDANDCSYRQSNV